MEGHDHTTIEQIILGFAWVSDLILQEWLVRSIGTAFFGWISVVFIRAVKLGSKSSSQKKAAIKKATKVWYIPCNIIWSSIFAMRYCKDDILSGAIDWFDFSYWYLIFTFISVAIHIIWTRGIAPYSDRRFKTNWLGND